MDGLKVNGAGSGFFEYHAAWPAGIRLSDLDSAVFVAEVSSKELFGKDREGSARIEGDFMRGRGTLDPSLNPPEIRPWGSKALINACMDYKFIKSFSKRTKLDKAMYQQVAKRWNEFGFKGSAPEISVFEDE